MTVGFDIFIYIYIIYTNNTIAEKIHTDSYRDTRSNGLNKQYFDYTRKHNLILNTSTPCNYGIIFFLNIVKKINTIVCVQ